MTNSIDIYSNYNKTIQQIRTELEPILRKKEEDWLANMGDNFEESMRGHYKKDLELLVSMITPQNYADCLECYDPKHMKMPFHDFLVQEVAEQIPAMLCNTLPTILGEEHVKDMIRFSIGQRFPDMHFASANNQDAFWDEENGELWSESDIEFFKQEIGEIGFKKLEKLEISAKVAYQAYRSITDDFVGVATTSDIIAAVKHKSVSGEFPDIEWLGRRSQ